jgi:hypothetical protein
MENRIFTICRMITWVVFLKMFWNYTPTHREGAILQSPCLSVRPSVRPSVRSHFVTDISAFTGRNDFIFNIWLWHGDLYHVSPFQVYCTSTSCLPCDLRIFHVFTAFSGNECWDIYKFDTNERVGVFLARRSVQHLVLSAAYRWREKGPYHFWRFSLLLYQSYWTWYDGK